MNSIKNLIRKAKEFIILEVKLLIFSFLVCTLLAAPGIVVGLILGFKDPITLGKLGLLSLISLIIIAAIVSIIIEKIQKD